jgi:UDP-N-acetylglucosamine--N-acetylmuramyl-(pentapeptide) pyrophosphoryl-undecaprenol N-acetylglucosamine transferase
VSRTFAVIAGGGTAGHVVPAIAIGRALVERGHPPDTVHFVGSRRGIDSRLVPAAGFPLTLLPGRGLARKLTVQNVASLAAFAVALVRAVALLARLRPAVVVSMGGYAAAPAGLAARALRVPLVLSEQNAVPTATHRLLRRFAVASAVPFEGTPLPNAVVTGNPVRPEILAVDRSDAGKHAARVALGLPPGGVVIAAVGGSLGARTINTAVLGLAGRWRDRDGVAIRHVIGERDWDASQAAIAALHGATLRYQAVRYEDRMPDLLAAADLVVSRAGGTVAELAVVGRASILVPLPIAPYDHQAANAQVLVRAGAAVMLRDHEVTPERLAGEIDALLSEPGRLDRMGEAALTVGHPDAAGRVADLVIQHARTAEPGGRRQRSR